MKHWGAEIGGFLPPDFAVIRRQVSEWLAKNGGPLLFPLLEVQKKSVAHAVALRYCCLFDDMGLGKTAQALAINAFGGHDCTLIICPNNVKKVWIAEIKKFLGFPASQVYVGSGAEIVTLPPKIARKYKFIIFNPEALVVAGKTPDVVPAIFKTCKHHILDEAHYFRNAHTAKFICYFNNLIKNPVHRLTVLTGTPIDRCVTDAWPYLAMLDLNPKTEGRPFLTYFLNSTVFAERYATPRSTGQGGKPTYGGYKEHALPEVGEMFGQRVIQRKIQEIVELPPLYTQDILLKLDIDEEEVQKKFQAAFAFIHKSKKKMEEFEKGEKTDDMFLKVVQKIRHDIAMAKAPSALEMAKKYRGNHGPVIIFSEFIDPLKWIKDAAWKTGLEALLVVGEGMHLRDREENIAKFKEGKTPLLLATFGAMSEGENLQMMQVMILNDLPWQPLVIKQAQRRIWRIGQQKPCFCVTLKCASDVFVEKNIAMKQVMINKLEKMFAEKQKESGLK